MTTIINELLCYMLNKVDSVPQDTLVRLISENFNDDEVETAKSLLCTHVVDSIKAVNRRGQNKKQLNIQDIYKMTLECDRDELPSFVALNLAKLPPVSIDCIDVSSLLRKQQLMEMEMCHMKSMIDDVLKVSVETSQKVETALAGGSKVGWVNSSREAEGSPGQGASAKAGETRAPAPPDGKPEAGGPVGLTSGPAPVRDATGSQRQGGSDDCGTASASYAEVAAAPASSLEEGWYVANKAKRGKPPPSKVVPKTSPTNKSVVGLQKSSVIKAVKSVRRVSLFVSRLPPDTDADMIQEYAKEQVGAMEVVATRLKSRFDTYASYRLDLSDPSVSDVLNPEIWAQGLLVRRFFTKKSDPVSREHPPPVPV